MKVENKKYIYKDPSGNYFQTNNAENFGCDTANVLSSFNQMNAQYQAFKSLLRYRKLNIDELNERLKEYRSSFEYQTKVFRQTCLDCGKLRYENDQLKATNEALEFQLRQTLIS
jgi:NAD-dependent SIR2 family protein deacetylase